MPQNNRPLIQLDKAKGNRPGAVISSERKRAISEGFRIDRWKISPGALTVDPVIPI
jgi:hypothetical protein